MRKALRCWALLCALLASLSIFLADAEPGGVRAHIQRWTTGRLQTTQTSAASTGIVEELPSAFNESRELVRGYRVLQ